MRRGIVTVLSMASLVWQVGAQATTDWDAKLHAEFQRANPPARIGALSAMEAPRPNRDMTLMLATARLHWNELSSDTQTLVRPWMLRPTQAGNSFEARWLYGSTPESTPTTTTHFKIHYIDKALNAGNANAATQSFVNSVATVLETVWSTEHTTLGYAAVPSDIAVTNNGGDGKFDVYLTNLGLYGLYGYVSAEDASNETARPYGATSYMVLDNDYQISEYKYSDPQLPLKVTAAHEYFHAVQNGYSYQEDPAFMEQSATWMEDLVYPTIHDNYNYIGEPYQDVNGNGQYDASVDIFTTSDDHNKNNKRDEGSVEYPEASLFSFDSPPLVQYGRFLWVRYLSEKFGNGIVKTIWENCGQGAGDNTVSAISTALTSNGSTWTAAYQEYATWGYEKSHFADGANYPLVWVDRTVNGTNMALSSDGSPSLVGTSGKQQYLSTIYTQILNPAGSYTFASLGGDAAFTVLVDNGTGRLNSVPVALTNGSGQWVAQSGLLRVVAVISNVAFAVNDMSWSLNTTGMTLSKIVPRLDAIVDSAGQTINWQSGNVTLHGTVNNDLIFRIVASDAGGSSDVPSIGILSNPTDGTYSPKTREFTWSKPRAEGTFTLTVAAYTAADVSNNMSGTITIVVDPTPRVSSSHKKGSVDGWFLALLTLAGFWKYRRQILTIKTPIRT